ncbi:MAG: hypothetical protein U9R68_08570, partial [Planctomycetota bacterium]|nr:hypothetical protein [Planctomycetota bacterium]
MMRTAICAVMLTGTAVAVLGAAATAADAAAPSAEAMDAAARLVRESGRRGGISAVVGAPNADLALALAKQGRFTVHGLYAGSDLCEKVREVMRTGGGYGTVSAHVLQGARLPYADNLITILVVQSWSTLEKGDVWLPEVLRVLAPLGTVYVRMPSHPGETKEGTGGLVKAYRAAGLEAVSAIDTGAAGTWIRGRKPWPPDIDEWTHYLHGPDGNPVARDTVVGPPRRYQWTSEPTWMQSHETDSSISTLVTARGRLLAIVNRAPTSLPGPKSPPDAWFLVARDAFNGVLLWEAPIRRWGWREWKPSWFTTRPGDIPLNLQKRLVADADAVYVTLGYGAPVSRL